MNKSQLHNFSFEKYAKDNQSVAENHSKSSRHIQEFINALDEIGEILKDPKKLEERRKRYKETGE